MPKNTNNNETANPIISISKPIKFEPEVGMIQAIPPIEPTKKPSTMLFAIPQNLLKINLIRRDERIIATVKAVPTTVIIIMSIDLAASIR